MGKELKVRKYDAERRAHGLQDVDPEELLHLATSIEGHPDNVAPAIYGGIQLSIQMHEDIDHNTSEMVMSRRVPFPNGMRLVAYVPSEAARLGSGLDKTDEMRNLLHRGDLKSLRFATRDRLHQPIRGEKAYPHLETMMQAALDAGAHGAFLSGAGPTVMALCSGQAGDIFTQRSSERQEGSVAEAMQKALDGMPPAVVEVWGGGTFYIVSPTDRGAHVTFAEPKFSSRLATFDSLDGPL